MCLQHCIQTITGWAFSSRSGLEAILSSSPSAAAGLKIQHAFECATSRQDCQDFLDSYVAIAGGDDSQTEDKMRQACGFPARVRSKDSGSAKLLVHVSDSQEERDCEERKWMHLRHMIANDLLERGVSSMTLFEFQKLSLGSDQVPNQSRADPWKGLAEKKLCVSVAFLA